ncbi:MAG: hypothetical protein LPK07_03575 [Hymenobacteraceae bacterium]|nr:hypothetical protein [Hymenobacteraceae bacterium]
MKIRLIILILVALGMAYTSFGQLHTVTLRNAIDFTTPKPGNTEVGSVESSSATEPDAALQTE